MFVYLFCSKCQTTVYCTDWRQTELRRTTRKVSSAGWNHLSYSPQGDIVTFLFFLHGQLRFLLISLPLSALPQKWRRLCATSLLKYKLTCIDKFMYMQACLASSINIYMHALHVYYPEALSHCGHGHDLISVAQLNIWTLPDMTWQHLTLELLSIKRWRRHAVAERPSKGGLLC